MSARKTFDKPTSIWYMPRVEIRLLGPFQVTLDAQPATDFESDKARGLLAYVTVEAEQPHRREKLAGLLWPDMPESSARNNLRRTLANVRQVIGDREAQLPVLSVSRQTVGFNSASEAWVDIAAFGELLRGEGGTRPSLSRLEEAVRLYGGGFLEGFSLSDSAPFEEWLLFKREQLHRQAAEALERLATRYEERGDYKRALTYAWREVELDPWREEAHQAVMRLLAVTGKRGAALAQYGACREMLADELGVEPSGETQALYRQIEAGNLAIAHELPIAARVPAFLQEDTGQAEVPASPFVSRERELARLGAFLDAALEGKPGVVFVTGGAGRGKTALVHEFARRAMETRPDLLVATGSCNAFSGVGDPYLPFREVLGTLTGDVEARWAAGAMTREHAVRLWAALPQAAQALVDCGASLVDILVPGPELLSRAASTGSGAGDWLGRLRALAERAKASPANLDQTHIFEQFTNVLDALAAQHPLALVLDDLQWADAASIGLLFHLGRRLANSRSRILLLCAYRPDEVALGRGGERHPLERVLTEFKRRFGDVWVELGRLSAFQDRAFVDALLDTEPHRLDGEFREALFRHTQGHPLFTIELLRALQERGDLVQDEQGQWTVARPLDWETLPPRVEGVIEERIGRLESGLRDILTIASVEGEDFTAQVVGRVQEISDRLLLRSLSQELERRHRLVREQGEFSIGRQRLSRYQFAHALFQSYLYGSISAGERRLLHREIGAVLEELYQDHPEGPAAIAGQLARHYAGDVDKERHYAQLAGKRAAATYAHEEALRYLDRAIELAPELDHAARYDLLLTREGIHHLQGDREAQAADLAALDRVAGSLADDAKKAQVALRRARRDEAISDYPAALAAARLAVGLAQASRDVYAEAQGFLECGRAVFRQGKNEMAREQFQQALLLASAGNFRHMEADITRSLAAVSSVVGDYASAKAGWEDALLIYRDEGDRRGESATLNNLGLVCWFEGDYDGAKSYYEGALTIFRGIGDRYGEGTTLGNLALVITAQGDFAAAKVRAEQSLRISRDIGDRRIEGMSHSSLAFLAIRLGDFAAAERAARQSLLICREIGDRAGEGWALSSLGRAIHFGGDVGAAQPHYRQSLQVFHELNDRRGEGWALLNLGVLLRDLGRFVEAKSHLEEGLGILREIGDREAQAWGLMEVGRLLADLGDFGGAENRLEAALRIDREIGDRIGSGWALAYLSRVYHLRGNDADACAYAQDSLGIAEEMGERPLQGDALNYLGSAYARMGDLTAAADAYRRALTIRRDMGQAHLATEPLAGLARVLLARGDLVKARAHVEKILRHLAQGSLDGTEEPFRVYLTCYLVLLADHDSRAQEVLEQACAMLQKRAAAITSAEQRRSFLENLPAHRELIEASSPSP
jgi:adenylate cyclase